MENSNEWLYLGEYSVYDTEYRVTIPPCVFDQYGILTRGNLTWLIYKDGWDALKLCDHGPESTVAFANHSTISSSGGNSPAAFITLPEEIRSKESGQEGSDKTPDSTQIPDQLTLSHGQTVHFVTEPNLIDGTQNALFLFTLSNLEENIKGGNSWIDDAKSLSRLIDSSASHLLDHSDVGTTTLQTTVDYDGESDHKKANEPQSLAKRLQISQNSVPEDFEVVTESVTIQDIPPCIYEVIELEYLLVRYGVSEQIRSTPSEDHELIANLNKDVEVETSYSEEEEKIVASVPFCIHNRHSLRFKFFVKVEEPDMMETVRKVFAESSSCESTSISDSLNPRVYMIHRKFPTTRTDQVFVNNIIYPK